MLSALAGRSDAPSYKSLAKDRRVFEPVLFAINVCLMKVCWSKMWHNYFRTDSNPGFYYPQQRSLTCSVPCLRCWRVRSTWQGLLTHKDTTSWSKNVCISIDMNRLLWKFRKMYFLTFCLPLHKHAVFPVNEMYVTETALYLTQWCCWH